MEKNFILLIITIVCINTARADFSTTPLGVTPNGVAPGAVTEKAVSGNHLMGRINSKILAKDFIKTTPKKVKKDPVRNLKIKKVLALRTAKKAVKKEVNKTQGGGDIPQIGYILLAIIGLAWIAMGIMDDWSGFTWIINLLLVLLFYFPGLIHALIMMFKYY